MGKKMRCAKKCFAHKNIDVLKENVLLKGYNLRKIYVLLIKIKNQFDVIKS